MTNTYDTSLKKHICELQLTWVLDNYEYELAEAARKNRTHQDLLQRLLSGECEARQARSVERALKAAKLKSVRSMEGFDFSWPSKINRDQVRHLFSLSFIKEATNVVFIGTVGLGKTHLASALARQACLNRLSVLFCQAIDIVNHLIEARSQNSLSKAIRRYAQPKLLVIDELGYLPLDKIGAELLFQVLCARYEVGSTIITTNRPYKDWAQTFANDATLTSAVLDRVNHHSETIIIEGQSYRMKDKLQS